jgi:hypothetical protein
MAAFALYILYLFTWHGSVRNALLCWGFVAPRGAWPTLILGNLDLNPCFVIPLLFAAAWFGLTPQWGWRRWEPRHLPWAAIYLLLIAGIWGASLAGTHSTLIEGHRVWFLQDDAMISMRYARNLARGLGLVWNPGERVEGFSNPLWTFGMALLHLARIPGSLAALAVILVNLLLAFFTCLAIQRLCGLLGGGEGAAGLAACAYALSAPVAFWAAAGHETILLTFLFLLSLLMALEDRRTGELRALSALPVALLALTRADSLALCCLVLALVAALRGLRPLRLYAWAFLPLAGYMLFRLAYYHDVLPNTAYLKLASCPERYSHGWKYLLTFITDHPLLLITAAASPWLLWERQAWGIAAIAFVYACWITYLGGDAFDLERFFVPILPLLIILASLGIQRLAGGRRWLYLYCFALVMGASSADSIIGSPSRLADLTPAFEERWTRLGWLIRENTSPETRVAFNGAGCAFYFSDRYGIDLLGKTDRVVAHSPAHAGLDRPGHNKYDYAHSLGELRPDLLVVEGLLPTSRMDAAQFTGDGIIELDLARNDIFKARYQSDPVCFEGGRFCFYIDKDSQLNARRGHWDLSALR